MPIKSSKVVRGKSRRVKKERTYSHSSVGKGKVEDEEAGPKAGGRPPMSLPEEEDGTKVQPSRLAGVCVVEDQRAVLACRGLPKVEVEAEGGGGARRPEAGEEEEAEGLPACRTTVSEASAACRAEKRRVVMVV